MPKQPKSSKAPRGGPSSRRTCSDLLTTPTRPIFPEVVMENSFIPTKEDLQHLDKVCRLCMVRGGPAMEHIFQNSGSTSIATQITFVTQLELRKEDLLPSRICQQCIFRLQLSQNFKQQCISSDKTLRDLYLTKEPIKVTSVASCSQSITGNSPEAEVEVNTSYTLKVEPLSPCCQEEEDDYDDDSNSQTTQVNDFKIEIVEHNLDEASTSSRDRGGSKAKKSSRKKGDKVPFVCEDCHRTYPTWDQLRRHRVYHSEKRIPCPEPECDRKFLRRAQLRRHLLWHSGEKPFACTECDKKFAAQTTLDVHMRLHTGAKNFKCHLCDKTFGHNSTLTTHVRAHLGDRPYQCPTCPQSFTAKSPLNKHIRTHTGFKPHKCPDCPLTFTLPGSLRAHSRTHTGERPFSCPHCDKTFAQPGGLKNHVRIHTGSKPFECKICNKSYRQQGAYGIHMRTHANIKPYSCDVCSRSFNVKKTLARHIRVHTGEKEFECPICHQAFSRDDGLATHMLIHSNEKPFECINCNKGFRQKMALVLHMRCHTGERPYKCVYCDMTFAQKGTMTTHMRVHTGEKPFDCSQCEKTFAQLGNLIDHKKRHHPYGEDAKGDETIQEILNKMEDEDEHEVKANKEDLLDDSDIEEAAEESLDKTDDKPIHCCELCSKTFLKLKTLIWHVERFHSYAEDLRKKNKKTKKAISSSKDRSVLRRAVSIQNIDKNASSAEKMVVKTDYKSECEDETTVKESNSVTDESTKTIGLITNELTNIDQSSNLASDTFPERGVSTDLPDSQTETTDASVISADTVKLDVPSGDEILATKHSIEDGETSSAGDGTVDPHENLLLEVVQTDDDCTELVEPSSPSTPCITNSGSNMPNNSQCVKDSTTSNLELVQSTPVDISESIILSPQIVNNDLNSGEIVQNDTLHSDVISDILKNSDSSITEMVDGSSDASGVLKTDVSGMQTQNSEFSDGFSENTSNSSAPLHV